MRLHIAVLLAVYEFCIIEKGICYQEDSHDPVGYSSDGPYNYHFNSSVYVVTTLNYFGNITAILGKWNARFPYSYRVPSDTIFRFQLWEKTDEEGVFIFRGENVFPYSNYKDYSTYGEFFPNDTDQLIIKPSYYVGFYAEGPTHFLYSKTVCKGQNKTWIFPVSDPTSPPSVGSNVTFQQYGNTSECFGFAFSGTGLEIDLSCKQEILTSIDGEGFIDIYPKKEIDDLPGDQPDKCWVVRIQRPCTSTFKRYLSPSVQIVEPEGCQDIHNFQFHNGGKQTYVTDMRCKDNVPTFQGHSYIFYFQYKVNTGHHFDHVKIRYYVDFDNEYTEHNPVKLCDGETLPVKANKRESNGGIIAGVVILTTVLIVVIAVSVVCKKGKKDSQSSDNQTSDPTAAAPLQNTGQQVQILPTQGPRTQPQVLYYPQPQDTTEQPENEPQTPPPPYTGDANDDRAPLGMSQVQI